MAFRHISELPLGDKVIRGTVNGGAPSAAGTAPVRRRGAEPLDPDALPTGGPQPALTGSGEAEAGMAKAGEAEAAAGVVRGFPPVRDCWVPQHEQELVDRFHRGDPVLRLAARFGRSPESVRAGLRALGHDPRRPAPCPPGACPAEAEGHGLPRLAPSA